ncbi:Hypothetical protein CINCED_3A012906 [Cinara cedri]|uniref:Uncharacterized protein n=1 Tax=Cinara cedri TaxID=506608 RepID=A0A5E4MWV1_9HEMI|nr:Hypothetical protein CINCED_3A012906 [Cinara cedri]
MGTFCSILNTFQKIIRTNNITAVWTKSNINIIVVQKTTTRKKIYNNYEQIIIVSGNNN